MRKSARFADGDEPAQESRLLLVDCDRTRRLDKNFEKFLRYDGFLTLWWSQSRFGRRAAPPFVLFVCQDTEQRDLFIDAADRKVIGHRWHPDAAPEDYHYVGRQRMLFAAEIDAHVGSVEARRMPAFPPGHRARQPEQRRVRVGPSQAETNPARLAG